MGTIYKTIIMDGKISLSILNTTDIVNSAINYHKLTPLTAASLGRTMTASIFMSSNLKNDNDKMSVTFSGNGVGGHIIVSCDSKLNVRGYIDNPNAELPLKPNGKLDVSGCVGKGSMTVVRSMGLKEPHVGTCEIVSGEIAEDFSYFYAVSEQEPTAMALGVKVSGSDVCVGAGGIVIQTLPGCDDETIAKAEKLVMKYTDISTQIQELGVDGIIGRDFSEYKFDKRETYYKCNCSKEYIDSVMISLGREELEDIIKENGKIEVNCQYCDKKYLYFDKDIELLFSENKDD